MKHALSLLVASCCLLITAARAADAPVDDAKAIAGTWVVESCTMFGDPVQNRVGTTMTFTADKIVVKGEVENWESKYKLDPSAKPKRLDLLNEAPEKPSLCIYELTGDVLKICIPEKPIDPRPPKLESSKSTTVLVLKRKK